MRNVLKDPELEKKFDKDGYVVVDLLTREEMEQLKTALNNLKETASQGKTIDSEYDLSFFNADPEYRKRVRNTVMDFFQPRVDKFLDNYKPLIVNLFDKLPGGGEVPVHQNWTFVDESKFASVSVWIPLVDVTRANGTMEVVKGSQRTLAPYRSPSIPWVFENLYEELKNKYMQPLNLTVGQVAIIDDSILHYTSRNDTDQVRSTVQLIMYPEEATPIHYYCDKENAPNTVEVYAVDSDFFTAFDMRKKPEGVEMIAKVPYKPVYYTEQEMVDKIAVLNPEIKELALA